MVALLLGRRLQFRGSLRFSVYDCDKDVAAMVARFTGASLGLFAFSITLIAGLVVQNPFTVTLSRGLIALFTFCLLGLVIGTAADKVLSEHERNQLTDLQAMAVKKREAVAEAEKKAEESTDADLATEGL